MSEPPPIDRILSPEVQASIRGEVEAAEGAEVFFYGRVDGSGVVVDVEVAARGHRTAAPALLSRAEGHEVAIHNHPSGDLRPSEADLRVATVLGGQGLGFLIVSNDARRAYAVVPPRPAEPPLRRVAPEEVEAFLGPSGPLAAVLGEGYEPRAGQVRMSRQVASALNDDRIALLESGTGTGKTFAYLVPAAMFSLRNGERVVVSTATLNLQAQIADKDVPHLLRGLKQQDPESELSAVVVKGRRNYVSLRRAEEAAKQDALAYGSDAERAEVERLVAWAQVTPSGERAELTPPPEPDAWEHVESTADNCLGARCPRFGDCHYYASRRAASQAQIVIVNHHLLFADLSIKLETGFQSAAALPPFTRVVLDEAHHVESIASDHFGWTATRRGLNRPLGRLRRKGSARRGLLPGLLRLLVRGEGPSHLPTTIEELLSLRDRAAQTLDRAFAETIFEVQQALGDAGLSAGESTLRVGPERSALLDPLSEALRCLNMLSGRLGRFVEEALTCLPKREREDASSLLFQLRAASKQLTRGASSLEQLLRDHDPSQYVRWVELRRTRRGRENLKLRMAPLDVGPALREALFERAGSVVLSSATLTVRQRFEYLESRLGLTGGVEPARLLRDVVPSPFDYPRQAVLAVPSDIPLPDQDGYERAVADAMRELVRLSAGRAFLLFTSHGALRRAHSALAAELEEAGLVPLRQGEDSRPALLDRFRATPGSVLFGTASFWEGVDVPGAQLVLVVIARLPFRVPTEPLQEARAEAVERQGGNPFRELQLPQAVLKLTQGFGRLIRTTEDRGAVVVLDRRLLTRWYGRLFLESLPPVRVETEPLLDLLPTLRPFVG